jgi:Fic family protein
LFRRFLELSPHRCRSHPTLGTVLRKARFSESHAGESFNDRQRTIVYLLLDGFEVKLTSTKWAGLARYYHDTASPDINELVKRGGLAKDAAGGRSTSYSLTEPPEIP